MTKTTYLHYLSSTLIPDLRQSGRDAMADDFEDLAAAIRDPFGDLVHNHLFAHQFVDYLEKTLVPDLNVSGAREMSKDFRTGIKFYKREEAKQLRVSADKHRRKRHEKAKKDLAAAGIVIRKADGEYRVNFRGGGEGTAYYTDDLDDALSTGQAMAKRGA